MINFYNNIPNLVKRYLIYLTTIRNRSIKTAAAYATDLKHFFKFYKLYKNKNNSSEIILKFNKTKINDINLNIIKSVKIVDVYEYLNFIMINCKNGAQARSRKVSSIRGFFSFLTHNLQVLEKNPVKNLESPSLKKSLPKFLTMNESLKLLKTQSKIPSKTKLRDYCILTLFLNCGLRLSELANLNLVDLKIENRSLKILGKGNKERIVFLNNACLDAINNYLKIERANLKKIVNKKALFLASRTGNRLCARQIENVVKISLHKANLPTKGFSPHKLRHTAATLLYQHGKVDILVLKELLGHANVGTTEIYTHVSNDSLKTAIFKNPLSNEKIKPNTSK